MYPHLNSYEGGKFHPYLTQVALNIFQASELLSLLTNSKPVLFSPAPGSTVILPSIFILSAVYLLFLSY